MLALTTYIYSYDNWDGGLPFHATSSVGRKVNGKSTDPSEFSPSPSLTLHLLLRVNLHVPIVTNQSVFIPLEHLHTFSFLLLRTHAGSVSCYWSTDSLVPRYVILPGEH